jgi:hypothetical protein
MKERFPAVGIIRRLVFAASTNRTEGWSEQAEGRWNGEEAARFFRTRLAE